MIEAFSAHDGRSKRSSSSKYDPGVVEVRTLTQGIGSLGGIWSSGRGGEIAARPVNGARVGAEIPFFRLVASGPRFSSSDPSARVASVQRDPVGLLSSDAYYEPHAR